MMVVTHSGSFRNMVKWYLKEEEKIGYKGNIGDKTHGKKFSLLNEILNIYILFENVIFVKFDGNA